MPRACSGPCTKCERSWSLSLLSAAGCYCAWRRSEGFWLPRMVVCAWPVQLALTLRGFMVQISGNVLSR